MLLAAQKPDCVLERRDASTVPEHDEEQGHEESHGEDGVHKPREVGWREHITAFLPFGRHVSPAAPAFPSWSIR